MKFARMVKVLRRRVISGTGGCQCFDCVLEIALAGCGQGLSASRHTEEMRLEERRGRKVKDKKLAYIYKVVGN